MPSVDELTRTLAELVPQVAAHGTFNLLLVQRPGAVGALLDAAVLACCASTPSRTARLPTKT